MSNTLPLDFASLMAAEKQASPSDNEGRSYTKTFRTIRFPLFTISPLILHLQGPTPLTLSPTAPEDQLIKEAFLYARALPKGQSLGKPAIKEAVEYISTEGRGILYQDKVAHRELLIGLADLGITVDPSKTASRTALLSTIASYRTALADFFRQEGVATFEQWQAKQKASAIPKLSADELAKAVLDL